MTVSKLTSTNLIEAANCAEVTAILISCRYRVYRPEAGRIRRGLGDPHTRGRTTFGSDERPSSCSLEALRREAPRGNDMWMLFPDPAGEIPGRPWFFIKHDELFNWYKQRHGAAPGWVQRTRQARRSGPKKVWAPSYASFYDRSSFPPLPRLIKGKFCNARRGQ